MGRIKCNRFLVDWYQVSEPPFKKSKKLKSFETACLYKQDFLGSAQNKVTDRHATVLYYYFYVQQVVHSITLSAK